LTALLELQHVSRSYGDVAAVRGLSLQVQAGEFVTLLGPSGCGKTTTLRLIAGFEPADTGTVTLNGRVIAGGKTFVQPEHRHIGMVFQDYALFPHLNVAQNIAFGLAGSKQEKAARVADMLELVGLQGTDTRLPSELSGGQQQRVALARALAPQPDILLLDEPFSNLDAALRAEVRGEVREILRTAHTTCIFVTHDQQEALSLSDRVAVMFAGQIAQIAPPTVIYEQPASRAVASFVGEANWLKGEAHGDAADCALGQVKLIEPAHGQVSLLIRPEQVHIRDYRGDGVQGRVIWREYYGHDQRIGVKLETGETLVARTDTSFRTAVGENTKLAPAHPLLAFPQ
jgi:iron(III) transport system ATP-binding protein